MKTTTVPAQITTVEDRFAGNLSLTQLLLLVCPVFLSAGIYIIFPPFLKVSIIKVAVSVLVFMLFGILAIRIKGKIVVMWLNLVLRYRARPRYYLFNKNDTSFRATETETVEEVVPKMIEEKVEKEKQPCSVSLAASDLAILETAIIDPDANFNFKQSKNGVLSVHIT